MGPLERTSEPTSVIDGYKSFVEHIAGGRSVYDIFYSLNGEGDAPPALTVMRFEAGGNAGVPRACYIERPARVAVGESLHGLAMGGEVLESSTSVSIRPTPEARAAKVACTMTRVK
ncbi:hypothetical protein [Deinococcus hohokamensis]|uniref:Uncharacterized protein n=1 Tax=Deinococcus hohokamensis TaxID=309883 RepID=A0ABV9I489_9DEIO